MKPDILNAYLQHPHIQDCQICFVSFDPIFSFAPPCQQVCKSNPAGRDIGPRFEISQQGKFRTRCSRPRDSDNSSSSSSEVWDLSLILLLIALMSESAKWLGETQLRRGPATLSPRLCHNNTTFMTAVMVRITITTTMMMIEEEEEDRSKYLLIMKSREPGLPTFSFFPAWLREKFRK